MQYSDIKQMVYLGTGTNSSSLPDAKMVILANKAVERCSMLILKADSRWQVDDTNQPDRPKASTDIFSGQKDYTLLTSHITIDRVELTDAAGNPTKLNPIDQHELKFESLAQHLAGTGTPLEYDLEGASVLLYPTPNFSRALGLTLYFTRPPVAFVAGDTTLQPGFNPLFHALVPLWITYDYAVLKLPRIAAGVFAEITRMEKDLMDFYGQRSRDTRPRFTVATNTVIGAQSGRLGYGAADSNK